MIRTPRVLAVALALAAVAPAQSIPPYNLSLLAPGMLIDWQGQPCLALWGASGGSSAFVARFKPHAKSTGTFCTPPPSYIGVRLVPQAIVAMDSRPCARGLPIWWSDADDSYWTAGAMDGNGVLFSTAPKPVLLQWNRGDCWHDSSWFLTYCPLMNCTGIPCGSKLGDYGPELWIVVLRVELL